MPRRTVQIAAVLVLGAAMVVARTGVPGDRWAVRAQGVAAGHAAKPVVRFVLSPPGGFDWSDFLREYASALPGINLELVTATATPHLGAIQSGEADLAMALAPSAYMAFSGRLGASHDRMRAISALGVAPLQLVARADARIRSVADLRSRSVNVGVPGSDHYRLAVAVLDAFGLTSGTYRARHLSPPDGAVALVAGDVDALFVVGSYPGTAVRTAMEGHVGRLVPIDGPPADRLRMSSGFFYPAVIPVAAYPGQTTAVRTLGVHTMLVCSRDLDEMIVYELTKQFFGALSRLSTTLGTLRLIEVDQASATSIPLHEGAARYYRARELSR